MVPRLCLFAAIDTVGNRWYSVSQAPANTDTFFCFMAGLLLQLDKERIDWRKDTVFLVDGASYHTSAEAKKRLASLGVPLLFTAPYSHCLSPIERLFRSFKQGDLNPIMVPTNKR